MRPFTDRHTPFAVAIVAALILTALVAAAPAQLAEGEAVAWGQNNYGQC